MNKVNLTVMLSGLLIGCLSISTPVNSQTVYRAVDELGNPAFTDRPEEYAAAEAISITIAGSDSKRVVRQQADVTSEDEDDGDDVAASIRAQHAAEDAAEMAQEQDVKAANCDKAKTRFGKYKSARRLFRQNDSGDKEFLSDEETDTARADASRSVDQWCGG